MSNLLIRAFYGLAVVVGFLIVGRMLLGIRAYRHQAALLAPRAAQRWKWRILTGLSGASIAICFGVFEIRGPGRGLDWLPAVGVIAGIGFLVSLLRLSTLEERW